jgi:hypothetical protein
MCREQEGIVVAEAEASLIIEWASAQPGLRYQAGRVLLLVLQPGGLRLN